MEQKISEKSFTRFIVTVILTGIIILSILNWLDSSISDTSSILVTDDDIDWRIKNEIERDPKSYCSLPIDYYNRNKSKYPNKYNIEYIKYLKKKRLETVPMCPNGNQTSFNKKSQLLSTLPPNLISYSNKCQIKVIKRNHREVGGLVSTDPLNIKKTKHGIKQPYIGFLHVFKAGGTSVRDTMKRIIPGLNRLTWKEYPGNLRAFLSDLFIFSYIRDPIERTLSGHFEIRRRNYTIVAKSDQTGINSLRYMLKSIKNRLQCVLNNEVKTGITSIYYNIHLYPQMLFLTDAKLPWGWLPINYVGRTNDIFNTTFEIIYEFWMKYYQNKTKMDQWRKYNELYVDGRNRHNIEYLNNTNTVRHLDSKLNVKQLMQYEIEIDDLLDDDIRNICETYWMDYICLPFDIPKQCNLTDLLLKHYGNHVEYKDCWDFTEADYPPGFIKHYRNTSHEHLFEKHHKRQHHHRRPSGKRKKKKPSLKPHIYKGYPGADNRISRIIKSRSHFLKRKPV